MDNSYAARAHEVMDHVRRHLHEDLSLSELAKIAHFSPHHFHRIFKSVTGETVADYTRRARLERAIHLMRGSPKRELSSIAVEVGFATPSDFSRVFRANYDRTPSSWDRISRLDGESDFAMDMRSTDWAGPPIVAHVVKRPESRLAYLRVRDPWQRGHLSDGYARLISWLTDRKVEWRRQELVGVSWESGQATPLHRLVYDLGITVGAGIHSEGEVGIHEFPAVRAVEVHCESLPETALAWDYLYGSWLPDSCYEPEDMPAMKRFRRPPEVFDAESWDVDCSIALRARRP